MHDEKRLKVTGECTPISLTTPLGNMTAVKQPEKC